MAADTLSTQARRLGSVLESVIGQVYFSPECHAGYEALGFDPSPGQAGGVALPDGPAYFTSRGSVMGQVPGELVAAAFAVFNLDVVIPAVALGWTRTDAANHLRRPHRRLDLRRLRRHRDRVGGSRGLLDDVGFTEAGREAREAVEAATDRQMEPVITALGHDIDELCSIMGPWGAAVRAGGYLASGPHDLGGRS